MKLKDNGLRFGAVTVFSHWLGAAILISFSVGVILTTATGSDAIRAFTLTIGLFSAGVHVFRMYWRLRNYHPAPLGGANPAQVLVGRGVAFGMLLAGIILPVMFKIKEGNWQQEFLNSQEWWFVPLFWVGFTCFLLGLLLHLYGAFTHVFTLKDDSLKRILGLPVDL